MTARQALTALAAVLGELATALESGRDDRVLPVEPRLSAALHAVRSASSARTPNPANAEPLDDLAAQIRDLVSRCRRMGGTVPALLSVMFPGRSVYGRDGLRRDASSVARPALTQVI